MSLKIHTVFLKHYPFGMIEPSLTRKQNLGIGTTDSFFFLITDKDLKNLHKINRIIFLHLYLPIYLNQINKNL